MPTTRPTKRQRAFVFFDQGKEPGDPVFKGARLKYRSCQRWFQEWKKEHGISPQPPDQIGEKPKAESMATVLEEGYGEPPGDPNPPPPEPQTEAEKPQTEAEKPQTEAEKPEGNGDKPEQEPGYNIDTSEAEEKKDGEQPVKGAISAKAIGQGIPVRVNILARTITLYEIFKNQPGRQEMLLGDFFDLAAVDYFQGRGVVLGLIEKGGKQE